MRELGQSLARKISSIANQQQNVVVTPSAYLGDWQEIDEPFSYISATVIEANNPNYVLSEVFAVGDPFRYKQGSNYKYGYVTNINDASNRLTVHAGSDFSFANSAITDIARGIKSNPTGFPYVFNYDANYRPAGGGTTAGTEEAIFSVQGGVVRVELNATFMTMSADAVIWLDLPVPAEVGDVAAVSLGAASQGIGAGNQFLSQLFVRMNPSYDAEMYRYVGSTNDATTWPTGAGRWSWTQVFTYQIEL